MKPKISAIICTLNRAQYLEKALNSLIHQSLPVKQYEIIIVDNGSIDDTEKISKEYCFNSNIQYLYEPIRGLSQARNTGWQNSSGEYIAFLDDDGLATYNWLEEIVTSFEKNSPSPDACGGKIELIWESNRPSWLTDSMLKPLGFFDYGNRQLFLNATEKNLGGGNMAFRKNIKEKIGLFNTNLGRKGSNLLSNEENEFFTRMKKQSLHIYYNPKIIALHHVTEERTKKKWFLQRYYWQGRSNAIKDMLIVKKPINYILIQSINAFYELIKNLLKQAYLSIFHSNKEQLVFENRCLIAAKFGYLFQIIRNLR